MFSCHSLTFLSTAFGQSSNMGLHCISKGKRATCAHVALKGIKDYKSLYALEKASETARSHFVDKTWYYVSKSEKPIVRDRMKLLRFLQHFTFSNGQQPPAQGLDIDVARLVRVEPKADFRREIDVLHDTLSQHRICKATEMVSSASLRLRGIATAKPVAADDSKDFELLILKHPHHNVETSFWHGSVVRVLRKRFVETPLNDEYFQKRW